MQSNTASVSRVITRVLGVFLAIIAIYGSGSLVATSYYALFQVSTSTVSMNLEPLAYQALQVIITPAVGDNGSGGEYGEGPAEYQITPQPVCIEWDTDSNCIDALPNLCHYLSFRPENGDDAESWIDPSYAPYQFAYGQVALPYDPSDRWTLSVTAPCFEGECPVGYNPTFDGPILSQSTKGETFFCDLPVKTNYQHLEARRSVFGDLAFAHSDSDTIRVSAVFGTATTTPEIPEEEPTPACTENCHSNVIFLPGLQASRLYKPDYSGGTDRLWEPNGNADVRDLYLDGDGKSIRSDIYAKEVIDEIFGLSPDIYKTFIEMMDGLKEEGTIVDWTPIPYDWRLTVNDILDNGTMIENGYSYHMASATPFIFQELERLARTSTTGKVTIIAHSNGGLVAKALMVRLEQMGKVGLVDKVILLASPQLGTPKAIASLLHGEDQEYLGGVIMNKPTARELGKNMPGGYQLLPSAQYFDVVSDPSIVIRNSTSTKQLFDAYGTSTDTIEDLYALLRGDEGRVSAGVEDVESLLNLNGTLITQAKVLHELIDGWVAPTSTQVIEIAGWGLDTIRGIRYTDRPIAGCTTGECRRLTYTPLFTDDGDETVVVPSAMATASSTRYWVDLFEANRKEDEKWSHKNISEVTQVKQLIKNILSATTVGLPSYISQTPSPTSITKKLRYTLHSPLSLGIYDSLGRYTGLSSSTILGAEYRTVLEEIPNSYYMEFGETKTIGFEEGSTTISMIGEALGVFTLQGERIEGGIVTSSTTFPDVPVATGTIVTLLQPIGLLSPIIAVDFDGNGTTDIQVGEDGFSEADGVALLRGVVTTLGLGTKQEKRLLTTIDRLENVVKKEFKKPEKRVSRLNKVLDRIAEVIQKMSQKGKVTNEDKTELLKLIGVVRQQVI